MATCHLFAKNLYASATQNPLLQLGLVEFLWQMELVTFRQGAGLQAD
jgi:hypothetical protein